MSAPAFQPGPWRASVASFDKKLWTQLNGGGLLDIVRTEAGDVVAVVWSDDDHDGTETARLIAAAPDLYEALAEAVECSDKLARENDWERVEEAQAVLVKMRAALASARGEQP